MGGYMSGFWRSRDARRCERMHSIDLSWLAKEGSLRLGASGTLRWSRNGRETGSISYTMMPGSLRLNYRTRGHREAWEDVQEDIPFAWTHTEFGGQRRWFRCPRCGRNCRIVYGGARFRCRLCHRLTYNSQYEPAWERPLTRAQDVRMKLGASGSIEDPFPPKPKGMHWRTYDRMVAKDRAAQRIWFGAVEGWLLRRL
jgi:hypothetical protein